MSYDPKKWPEYDKIWNERLDELWEKFAEEFLGYNPTTKELPLCHGTGDGHDVCDRCDYSSDC